MCMILVAPTAFKGTIPATAVARAMAAGARRAAPAAEVVELPISDGGPGLVEALEGALGGAVQRIRVGGPLGEPVEARLLRLGRDVVLESADACGLQLVPPHARDPLRTTTYGVGEMIEAATRPLSPPPGPDAAMRRGGDAARVGMREGGGERGGKAKPTPSRTPSPTLAASGKGGRGAVVLGLGGSATVDGGAGMAEALGWRLEDGAGRPIPRGGGGLARLARILPPVAPRRLPPVVALADVHTPLLGAEGAAAVFGPQKGADPAGVRLLEAGLARLASRIEADLGVDVRALRGGGAAGGLGAGIVAFLGGEIAPGSERVLDAVGFDASLSRAELLVTGEGSYDAQSGMGKVVGEVVARARRAGVPVLLVAGRIEGALPAGVVGVDGAGEALTVARLEETVARAVARLLSG